MNSEENQLTNQNNSNIEMGDNDSANGKRFACYVCNKDFSTKNMLKRHSHIHLRTEKDFVCDVCHSSYSRKDALKRHLLTHTGEKSFVCDMCDDSFSRKDELDKHFLTHTVVEKPHFCYWCCKSFTREDSLKRHTMTHTGKKPHVCEICQRAFSRKDQLDNHVYFHLNTKQRKRRRKLTADELTGDEDVPPKEEKRPSKKGGLKTRLIIHIKRRQPLRVASPVPVIKTEPE